MSHEIVAAAASTSPRRYNPYPLAQTAKGTSSEFQFAKRIVVDHNRKMHEPFLKIVLLSETTYPRFEEAVDEHNRVVQTDVKVAQRRSVVLRFGHNRARDT